MLKLSNAIAHWAPSDRAPGTDALGLLQAGWEEIVGVEVAANSAPIRLNGSALLIATRSGAWSHQLSLLSDRVLAAIGARLPAAGIEQLRFRVGSLPKRRSARPPAARPHASRRHDDEAPSANAGAALSRFREHVEASQRAKRSAGWNECQSCAAPIPAAESGFCAACDTARFEERVRATARLLFEAPWLGFAGTSELVDGLSKREYERIRSQLLKRWWGMLEQARTAGRISRSGRERLIASSYVVLRSKLPPEQIMPATVRNVLGDALHDLLYAEERKA